MKKILLCPPTFFNIEYEINPWMDIESEIDRDKVLQEYDELKATYAKLGVEYFEMQPNHELPDQVYTTDTGHPEANTFIKSNFKFIQRRHEADIAEAFF